MFIIRKYFVIMINKNKWKSEYLIGKGQYGRIYRITHPDKGVYAVKIFSNIQDSIRELYFLQKYWFSSDKSSIQWIPSINTYILNDVTIITPVS
jgi:hypothetical protein